MNVADQIPALLRGGAALTLYVAHADPQTLVLAAEHVLTPRALIYYVVGRDYTGGVHRLGFDELRSPHSLAVEFVREGKSVAYLTTVAEDGEESAAGWRAWQTHLETHRAAHLESVTAEFRGFEEE